MTYSIRAIPFSEIVDYISGDDWKGKRVLPITLQRARSQQQNPFATKDDTCLWVAEDVEGEVIGFAGSLPGYDVHSNAGMGWNTCWWVDPDRGREVAMPLFFSFLQRWDQRVAFADMSSHTHSIIQQLDFCHTREEKLLMAYVRVPAAKIIAKFGLSGKILFPVIMAGSFLVNTLKQAGLKRLVRRGDADLAVSIAQIDEDVFKFVKDHRERDFLHRTLEEYRWIEQYPWLNTAPAVNHETGSNYPFSHLVKFYRQEWLISCRKGVIVSVMLISIRDGVLKVLSYFGNSSADTVEALSRYVIGSKEVQTLIISHPDLLVHSEILSRISLRTTIRSRWVGVSKKIMDHFPEEMVIQLGDGDSVFT